MRYPAVRNAVLPAPAAPHGAAPVARLFCVIGLKSGFAAG